MTDTTREALEKVKAFVAVDAGPWHFGPGVESAHVYSNDFTHDVALKVTGDFDGNRTDYAERLAECLNALPALLALAADAERLDFIERECVEVSPRAESTGGDDADTYWSAREFHMTAPHIRELGRGATIRAAIDTARQGADRGEGVGS